MSADATSRWDGGVGGNITRCPAFWPSCQEQEKEAAAAAAEASGADDAMGDGEGEGEEEEPRENDPLLDAEDDARSQFTTFSAMPGPTLNLGSIMQAKTSEAPKKRQKKEAKQDDVLLTADIEGNDKLAAEMLKEDSVLMMMVEDLGHTPQSFYGLIPHRVLVGKESLGRPIRGAGFLLKPHEPVLGSSGLH